MYLAEYFAKKGLGVHIVEKESQFMQRASYSNQARVHNGYHYPRSILTALRSRISFPRFVDEFKGCINSDFEKYYLIGKLLGKVSAKQFRQFCERVGAHCEQAPEKIKSITNPALIEDCFSVVEYAFDAVKLRDLMVERLSASKAQINLETFAEIVVQKDDGLLVELLHIDTGERETVYADHVFNCTYSNINHMNEKSGIELVPLKHEMTEMCLVEVPDQLKKVGITIMCGPFFSVMPFPPAGLHSFSHVRYTPHYEWKDEPGSNRVEFDPKALSLQNSSAWRYMQKDASRYIPIFSECVYHSSIWEVKTVLPRSEVDDSRPILFLPHYGFKGFHCIMGGKIDNVYDAIESIELQKIID